MGTTALDNRTIIMEFVNNRELEQIAMLIKIQ